MKCSVCGEGQDFLLLGRCPACYKQAITPVVGDPVSQVMDNMASVLVADPGRLTREPTCKWHQGDDWDYSSVWTTSCGLEWSVEEGTLKENSMNFCPKCGKKLVEVPFVPEPEEEE
jgi:hypothetical protein